MHCRTAVRGDLAAIVALLADDVLGRSREVAAVDDTTADTTAGDTVVDEAYQRAFADIDADPRNQLVVAEQDGEVIGCLQITYIPGLGRHGTERSLIEAVRVRSDRRGAGVGRAMLTWAIDQARGRGCGLVQLTTDKRRTDAQRFYLGLGFTASHEGMKLAL
ncbi:GNAT family N-acetyltransferase [Micromonospora cathayae]|uniref:GNAT family N-acetyltransferase n=1 Tax=Micromonospora cathayae TaxID=3028804 RepID=A0ABY7ZZ18_9ACTN|nr:GNAT family N-acetyltransferase [Micromonospora sp. HUAS 3]WDZ88066.1 GNAT family N-acetyltransferase [Micromonospora sp. HUAS 3]